MPFARAENSPKAGRPLWWVAGLLVCALLAGLVYALTSGGSQTAKLPKAGPDRSTAAAVDTREDTANRLLQELSHRLEGGSRRSVLALADPGNPKAARELAGIHRNVRRLRITDLDMRYVDEDSGRLSVARQRALGRSAWVGDVQVTWRLQGYDSGESRMEVPLTLVETGKGAAFVSARDSSGDQAPLWLLARLAVERGRRTLVMVADRAELGRFSALADRAVIDVRRVLPRWAGKLVVEVPRSESQLNRVLGSKKGQYDAIAAVTTTVDGSLVPHAPTHIFVNPPVFDPLGARGSQIVMSHEATHVATKAATSTMPTWLLEGFADYIALAHVELPVSVTASQILGQVRKDGPPAHLPGRVEFNTENTTLGASYEAAWLACRLIAQKYGEARLIDLYRASDQASSTRDAFRSVLGTSEAAFTRAWRNYLEELAS